MLINKFCISFVFSLLSSVGIAQAQFSGSGTSGTESISAHGITYTLSACEVSPSGSVLRLFATPAKDGSKIYIRKETRIVDALGKIFGVKTGSVGGIQRDLDSYNGVEVRDVVAGIPYPIVVEVPGSKTGNPPLVLQLHNGDDYLNFRSAKELCQ